MLDRQHAKAGIFVATVILALGLFRSSNEFVLDDDRLILHGEGFGNLSGVLTIFGLGSEAFQGKRADAAPVDSYRPLSVSSLMVNTAVFGREPAGFHITNLLLHLLVTWFVFLFIQAVLGSRHPVWTAVGALLFAIHPVLSEAHVWIDGRSDPLAAAFLAPAMYLLYRDSIPGKSARPAWAAGGLVLFACFSKEMAVMFSPILFVLATGAARDGELSWARFRDGLVRVSPAAVAVIAYLVTRVLVMSGLSSGDLLAHVKYLPALCGDAFSSLFWPTKIGMRTVTDDYHHVTNLGIGISTAIGIGFACIAIGVRKRAPLFAIGVAALYAALVPITLFVTLPWVGFGRYSYLPGILLIPGIVQLGRSIGSHVFLQHRLGLLGIRIVLSGVLLLWASLSVFVALDYRTPESFYSAAVRDWPHGRYGYLGLGEAYATKGQYEEAVGFLKYSAHLAPPDWPSVYYLAHSYLALKNIDAAREVLLKAPADQFHKHWYTFLAAIVAKDSGKNYEAEVAACMEQAPTFTLCIGLSNYMECLRGQTGDCVYEFPLPPGAWDLNADGPATD